jgi:hypothetical protein
MIDVPDLGYVSSSDPPQGEIWLRGANIFKGWVQFLSPDAS